MKTADQFFEEGMQAISLSHHADYRSEFLGDLQDAVAAFDQALALEPKHLRALQQRGLALALLERHEDALDSFVAAASLAPADADLHLAVAQSLTKLGRPEAALASFDEVLRLRPGDDEALFSRATTLMVLRRDEAAVAAWDLVLGSDTRSLNLHGRQVRVLTEDYRRLQAELSRATALGRLGRAEAGAVFREVFERHVGQLEGSFVARAFEEALSTLEVARTAYLAHLEAHGADHNTWRRAAGTWISMRCSDEAIAAWDRVLALAPEAHAWFGKAEALAQKGQLDDAIAAYERSLELQPGFLAARARLKVVRDQRAQQPGGAGGGSPPRAP